MIPSNFSYIKAGSLSEAFSLLNEHGDDARILAGGHSLIPALKLRLNDYKYLIDISKIDDLKAISESGGEITIGAGVTHAEIAGSSLIQQKLPYFSEAANLIGDVQVRNKGTIGGSVAHADPAADWPALLLAAKAKLVLHSDSGSREVAASGFFQGLFMTDLKEGEIITAIKVPAAAGKTRYMKFMQPASRFALVGCAASVTLSGSTVSDITVAYNGVSAKPFICKAVAEALNGKEFNEANIDAAAAVAAGNVQVMSDVYASEAYRLNMTRVYTARTLKSLL